MTNARRVRLFFAVTVLAVFSWFLLDTLDREARKMEEQAANLVMAQLRSALVIKGAEILLARDVSLSSYEGRNPFVLLEHHWPNYKGGCEGSLPEPGFWCFRETEPDVVGQSPVGQVVYRSRSQIKVAGRLAEPGELLAWTVEVAFSDRNHNGLRDPGERSTGLILVAKSAIGA